MKITTLPIRCGRAVQIATLSTLLTVPTGLIASISIDGNVGGIAEGYTSEYDVSFNVQNYNSNPVSGGQLFTAVNGNVLSVGVIIPTTIDDNVYSSTKPTPGWEAASHTQHQFSDLTGSDEWDMTINAGANKFVINLDYLEETVKNPASGVYDAYVKKGTDNNVDIKSAIQVASSLQWNLANVDSTATANSSSDSRWIKNIEYEWQIDFSGTPASFTVDDLLASMNGSFGGAGKPPETDLFHLSPNKLGGNDVVPNPPVEVPVPEASTMIAGVLLLLPLGASTLRILRRTRRA